MKDGADIEVITLERGQCFGSCPVYTVTLRRDGTTSWHGKLFTLPRGDAVGEIKGQAFADLAAFIERAGFFGWASLYSTDITCVPEYALTVVAKGRTKAVHQRGTYDPPGFGAIARRIDECARDLGWCGRVPERPFDGT
jgi:hypothetical protein